MRVPRSAQPRFWSGLSSCHQQLLISCLSGGSDSIIRGNCGDDEIVSVSPAQCLRELQELLLEFTVLLSTEMLLLPLEGAPGGLMGGPS